MSIHLTPEQVRALGLEGAILGEVENLPRPAAEPVGQGRAGGPGLTIEGVRARLGELIFDLAPVRAAAELGLHVSCARGEPALLMICTVARLSCRSEDPRGVLTTSDAVYLHLRELGGPAALEIEGRGEGIVVSPYPEGVGVFAFSKPLPIPQLPKISSEVVSWCTPAGDDWLLREVCERVDGGDALEHAIAVGMAARLVRPSPGEARSHVKRLIEGVRDPGLSREWEWVRSLSEEQRRGLEELGVSAASGLLEDLERLLDEPRPDEQDWREGVLSTLRRRDELEGVRQLLRVAGAARRIDAALARVDEEGEAFILAIPSWKGAGGDEHLLRASCGLPEAWWVEPTRW